MPVYNYYVTMNKNHYRYDSIGFSEFYAHTNAALESGDRNRNILSIGVWSTIVSFEEILKSLQGICTDSRGFVDDVGSASSCKRFHKRTSRGTMKYWLSSCLPPTRNVFTRCLHGARIIFAVEHVAARF